MKHRILPLILFAGGISAFYFSVTSNAAFNASLTQDAATNFNNGGISITLDVLAVAFACSFGTCLARRHFGSAIVVASLALVMALFSLSSSIGYSASGRIANSRVQAEIAKQEGERAAARTKALVSQADWLKGQVVEAPRSTRQTFMAESTSALNLAYATPTGPIDLAAMSKRVMPDAGAQIIAEIAGVPVERAQLGMAIAIAVLLIVGKVGAFAVGSHMWVREEAGPIEPAKARIDIPVADLPKIEIASTPDLEEFDEAPPAHNVVTLPRRKLGPIEAIEAFVESVICDRPFDSNVMFAAYKRFCTDANVEARAKRFFMRTAGEMGIQVTNLQGGTMIMWRPGSHTALAA